MILIEKISVVRKEGSSHRAGFGFPFDVNALIMPVSPLEPNGKRRKRKSS